MGFLPAVINLNEELKKVKPHSFRVKYCQNPANFNYNPYY